MKEGESAGHLDPPSFPHINGGGGGSHRMSGKSQGKYEYAFILLIVSICTDYTLFNDLIFLRHFRFRT